MPSRPSHSTPAWCELATGAGPEVNMPLTLGEPKVSLPKTSSSCERNQWPLLLKVLMFKPFLANLVMLEDVEKLQPGYVLQVGSINSTLWENWEVSPAWTGCGLRSCAKEETTLTYKHPINHWVQFFRKFHGHQQFDQHLDQIFPVFPDSFAMFCLLRLDSSSDWSLSPMWHWSCV